MRHITTSGARLLQRIDAGRGKEGQLQIVVERIDHYLPQRHSRKLQELKKLLTYTTSERTPILPVRAYLYDGDFMEFSQRYEDSVSAVDALMSMASFITTNAREKDARLFDFEGVA